MRIAVAISGTRPAGEAISFAQDAERLGFDECWVTEDYYERGAFGVAGALLARTDSLTVGIGVVNPWTRHPMLIAMEAAALAEIGPGRLRLGLGASNSRWMSDQLGIAFARPVTRLGEAVQIIRAALRGEQVRHEGLAGRVDARLAFTPPAEVPIVLGVKGPRALALGARVSDGLLLSILSSPPYVRSVRERVGAGLDLAGYVTFVCDADDAAARDRARPVVAKYLGVHGDHEITRVAGVTAEQAAAFRAGWISGSPRVDLVDDAMIETFVLAGTPDTVARGIRRFADAGLSTLVVHDQGGDMTELLTTVAAAAELAGVRAGRAPVPDAGH
jgi:5,10-methylenetetrahydromethanopterin reductase